MANTKNEITRSSFLYPARSPEAASSNVGTDRLRVTSARMGDVVNAVMAGQAANRRIKENTELSVVHALLTGEQIRQAGGGAIDAEVEDALSDLTKRFVGHSIVIAEAGFEAITRQVMETPRTVDTRDRIDRFFEGFDALLGNKPKELGW